MLRMFLNLSKKADRFGFIAWLAGIVRRDHHLDFDGHDVFLSLN
jgi:hypothetical protein